MKKFDIKKLQDAYDYSRSIIQKSMESGSKTPLNELMGDDDVNKFLLGIFVTNCIYCEFSVFLKPYDNELFERVVELLENNLDNIVVPQMPIFKYRNELGNFETTSVEDITIEDIEKAINNNEHVAIYKFENNKIIGKLLK